MKMRIAFLSLLVIACLTLAVTPAMAADIFSYNNGATNGNTDAWTITGQFSVSDSFDISRCGQGSCDIDSLSFAVWQFPGDQLTSVVEGLGAEPFGTEFSNIETAVIQTADLGINSFGFDVAVYSGFLGPVNVAGCGGACWLTLSQGQTLNGDPVFWDENSGPSLAFESSVGSIPSEAFTIGGNPKTSTTSTTPEPSSIMLFGSGVLGLAGILRRKLTR